MMVRFDCECVLTHNMNIDDVAREVAEMHDFDSFMQQIGDEARAEGTTGAEHAESLQVQFKLAADLFARRQELGISQASLSQRCGVPQADISRIERGQANPTMATIERLMNAMGGGDVTLVWKVG